MILFLWVFVVIQLVILLRFNGFCSKANWVLLLHGKAEKSKSYKCLMMHFREFQCFVISFFLLIYVVFKGFIMKLFD